MITRMRRWYPVRGPWAQSRPGCGRLREAIEQYYKEDIEAALDRAMVEGYTRVPDDDEFDGLAELNAQTLIGEEPW